MDDNIKARSQAEAEGYSAAASGAHISACPYPNDPADPRGVEWTAGFHQFHADNPKER